jgi:CHAT domain-containing protein
MLAAALFAAGWPAIRPVVARVNFDITFARARLAAGNTNARSVRLSIPDRSLATFAGQIFPPPKNSTERSLLAAKLLRVSRKVGGDEARYSRGIAYLLAGDSKTAGNFFVTIPEERRDVGMWTDIAAVHIGLAAGSGEADEWIAALDAADRALGLDRGRPEARFNRAVILDAIGVTPVARTEWWTYRTIDSNSHWAAIAQQRLASPEVSEAKVWKRARLQLEVEPAADLNRLTQRFPQQVRAFAEGLWLPLWAEAISQGDRVTARRHLDRARSVGKVLRTTTGESLLADVVADIDGLGARADLVAGLLSYRDGRWAYRDDEVLEAERQFRAAAGLLARARSPMAAVARFYIASTLHDQNRNDEALALLQSLLTTERNSKTPHKGLLARIQYEISVCEAIRGHWSDSLAAARESMAIFARLGERANAAEAEAGLSEDYDFLGQAGLARRHAIAALRTTCTFEDFRRARTILAVMARTESRGGHWNRARAIINVEEKLAYGKPAPQLDADMFLRKSAVASQLGHLDRAIDALFAARAAARRIIDPAAQARLLADIDGIEGHIVGLRDPKRAIALLSAAIAFQQKTARRIVLPELYLERGRIEVRLEMLVDAQRDFDAGIVELESQRVHVADAELRPGIFDDAAELFHEAISLQIRRGADPAAVLASVERGRARTLFEQLGGSALAPNPTETEIRRNIPAGMALAEYVCLPRQLVVFIVTSRQTVMRVFPVPRSALGAKVSAFVAALSSKQASSPIEARSAELFDVLIRPVEDLLSGATTVTVIADDLLQRIPFGALLDRKSGAYFVEHYAVATNASAAVFLAGVQHAPAANVALPATALVFANPTMSADLPFVLPSLNAAEAEAASVAREYAHATLVLRDEATAARFVALAPSFDVVHFAGHAVMQRTEPGSSALICAASEGSSGAVTSRDIARMQLRRTRVVVLAACSTMAGRNAAVEGVASLARAFLVAGAPVVVGTLWDIDDGDAAPLMKSMHHRIARGETPAQAIRAAQIEAIHSDRSERRDPRKWAAFELIGQV